MNNRGVSNVLGYVLLFGVIITSITIVGTAGVEQLNDARDGTVALNAEHTMTDVAGAVDDVHEENVSRTSRVGLGGGVLESGGETRFEVQFGIAGPTHTVDTRSIRYRTGDTQIVYVAGAVFRLEDEGETVVREPNYLVDSSQTIISVPGTAAIDPDHTVSGSNANVFLARDLGSERVETDDSVAVELTITPPPPNDDRLAELWREALEDTFSGSCTAGSGQTTCTITPSTDDVIFRTTTTEYEFST